MLGLRVKVTDELLCMHGGKSIVQTETTKMLAYKAALNLNV